MFLRCLAVLGIALSLCTPTQAHEVCDEAARDAARSEFLPESVILAASRLMSHDPHPWSLQLDGTMVDFSTREEAIEILHVALARGQTTFVIGCFRQLISVSDGIDSLDHLFDPQNEARRTAQQLFSFRSDAPSWSEALRRFGLRQGEVLALHSIPMPETLRIEEMPPVVMTALDRGVVR